MTTTMLQLIVQLAQTISPAKHTTSTAPRASSQREPEYAGMLITGRFDMGDQSVDTVRTCVRQDLLSATPVAVEEWVDRFLGVSPPVFTVLVDKITEEKWYSDTAIQKHLKAFCYAKNEGQRYEPAIGLFTRILAQARTAMKTSALGLPAGDARKSFPIPDITIIDGSEHPIQAPEEQGKLDAKRKPDLLVVRKRPSKLPIAWHDVLTWFELKFVFNLTDKFNKERVVRGLRRCADYDIGDMERGEYNRVRVTSRRMF